MTFGLVDVGYSLSEGPTKKAILFKDTSAAFLICCLRRSLETISKKVCFTSPLKQRLLNRVVGKRARS